MMITKFTIFLLCLCSLSIFSCSSESNKKATVVEAANDRTSSMEDISELVTPPKIEKVRTLPMSAYLEEKRLLEVDRDKNIKPLFKKLSRLQVNIPKKSPAFEKLKREKVANMKTELADKNEAINRSLTAQIEIYKKRLFKLTDTIRLADEKGTKEPELEGQNKKLIESLLKLNKKLDEQQLSYKKDSDNSALYNKVEQEFDSCRGYYPELDQELDRLLKFEEEYTAKCKLLWVKYKPTLKNQSPIEANLCFATRSRIYVRLENRSSVTQKVDALNLMIKDKVNLNYLIVNFVGWRFKKSEYNNKLSSSSGGIPAYSSLIVSCRYQMVKQPTMTTDLQEVLSISRYSPMFLYDSIAKIRRGVTLGDALPKCEIEGQFFIGNDIYSSISEKRESLKLDSKASRREGRVIFKAYEQGVEKLDKISSGASNSVGKYEVEYKRLSANYKEMSKKWEELRKSILTERSELYKKRSQLSAAELHKQRLALTKSANRQKFELEKKGRELKRELAKLRPKIANRSNLPENFSRSISFLSKARDSRLAKSQIRTENTIHLDSVLKMTRGRVFVFRNGGSKAVSDFGGILTFASKGKYIDQKALYYKSEWSKSGGIRPGETVYYFMDSRNSGKVCANSYLKLEKIQSLRDLIRRYKGLKLKEVLAGDEVKDLFDLTYEL